MILEDGSPHFNRTTIFWILNFYWDAKLGIFRIIGKIMGKGTDRSCARATAVCEYSKGKDLIPEGYYASNQLL